MFTNFQIYSSFFNHLDDHHTNSSHTWWAWWLSCLNVFWVINVCWAKLINLANGSSYFSFHHNLYMKKIDSIHMFLFPFPLFLKTIDLCSLKLLKNQANNWNNNFLTVHHYLGFSIILKGKLKKEVEKKEKRNNKDRMCEIMKLKYLIRSLSPNLVLSQVNVYIWNLFSTNSQTWPRKVFILGCM